VTTPPGGGAGPAGAAYPYRSSAPMSAPGSVGAVGAVGAQVPRGGAGSRAAGGSSGGAAGAAGAAAAGARPAHGPAPNTAPNAQPTTQRPGRSGTASSAPRRPKPERPPRLAALQVRRIDPWTALKISLVVSIVMFFVWMIAVGVLYLSLDAMDVWTKINDTYNTLVVAPDSTTVPAPLITPGKVFGVTAVIGAVNIVLFTALSAIAAFVYNAASGMVGGVEVTLSERD